MSVKKFVNFLPRNKPRAPALRWTRPDTTGWNVIEIGDVPEPPEWILIPSGNYLIKQVGPIHRRCRFICTGTANVAWIGGDIDINQPWVYPGYAEGTSNYYAFRCALQWVGDFRLIYMEGIHMHGDYLVEGVNTAQGTLQDVIFQNCRIILNVPPLPDRNQSDGFLHTDCFQSWAGLHSYRAANCTFQTTHQGGMFGDGGLPYEGIRWKQMAHYNVNYRLAKYKVELYAPTSSIITIVGVPAIEGPLILENTFVDPQPRLWGAESSEDVSAVFKPGGVSIFVEDKGRTGWVNNHDLKFPVRGILDENGGQGYFWRGAPPNGDFCPEGVAGVDYVPPPNVIAEPNVNCGIDNYAHDDNKYIFRSAIESLGNATVIDRKWFIEMFSINYTPGTIGETPNLLPAGDVRNFATSIASWQKTFGPDSFDCYWESTDGGVMVFDVKSAPSWTAGAIADWPGGVNQVEVTPGETIYGQIDIKRVSGADRGAAIFIVWVDASGAWLTYSIKSLALAIRESRYVTPYYQIVVPEDAAYALLGIAVMYPTAGSKYLIDNAFIGDVTVSSDLVGTVLSTTTELEWKAPQLADYRIRYECNTNQGLAYDDVIVRTVPHTPNWMLEGVDFELGRSTWIAVFSSTVLDVVIDSDGDYVLQATATADGNLHVANGYASTYTLPAVDAGDSVYAAIDIKCADDLTNNILLGVCIAWSSDAGGDLGRSPISIYSSPSRLGYQTFSTTAVAPAGAAKMRIYVVATAQTLNGNILQFKNPWLGDAPAVDQNRLSQPARSFNIGLSTWVPYIAPSGFSYEWSSDDGGVMVLSTTASLSSMGVAHCYNGNIARVSVIPGNSMFGYFHIKRIAGGENGARVRIVWVDANSQVVSFSEGAYANDFKLNSNDYATVYAEYDPPVGALYAILVVIVTSPEAGSRYYVDNCWLGDKPSDWDTPEPPPETWEPNKLPAGNTRDFATDKAHWVGYLWPQGSLIDWSQAFGGSLRIQGPATRASFGVSHTWSTDRSYMVAVEPGDTLYGEIEACRYGGVDGGVYVCVIWLREDFSTIRRTEGPARYLPESGEFVTVSMSVDTPEGAAFAILGFIANQALGGVYYLDNAYLGDPV